MDFYARAFGYRACTSHHEIFEVGSHCWHRHDASHVSALLHKLQLPFRHLLSASHRHPCHGRPHYSAAFRPQQDFSRMTGGCDVVRCRLVTSVGTLNRLDRGTYAVVAGLRCAATLQRQQGFALEASLPAQKFTLVAGCNWRAF